MINLQRVFWEPWSQNAEVYGWILLMACLVSVSCALLGCFLLLRRMALLGDAVSHAVLPGIVLAYLWAGSLGSHLALWVGAVSAGVFCSLLIETIRRTSRIKEDAALGIVLTSLFAFGMVLISLFAGKIDLDAECVLYGELAFVPLQAPLIVAGYDLGPTPVVVMGGVTLILLVATFAFYRPLLLTSFDPLLAGSLGIRPGPIHYGLMVGLSITIVSAFEAVGAILVVAMLILPAATAYMCASRLPWMLFLACLHGLLSSLLGLHLAIALDCSIAAAMVLAGTGLFGLAWLLAPLHGILPRHWRRRASRALWNRQTILDLLAGQSGPLEVSELARLSGWAVPPLLRLLKQLARDEQVELSPQGVRASGLEKVSDTT